MYETVQEKVKNQQIAFVIQPQKYQTKVTETESGTLFPKKKH